MILKIKKMQIKKNKKKIQLIGIIWGIKEYYFCNNLNLTYLSYIFN